MSKSNKIDYITDVKNGNIVDNIVATNMITIFYMVILLCKLIFNDMNQCNE